MQPDDIEKVELELFLEAIYQRYGYDFRHYVQASVHRRVRHILAKSGVKTSEISSQSFLSSKFIKSE